MTDQLLNLLKLALLALIYLFFGRVLWAVWSEVRTPVAAAGSRIRRDANRTPNDNKSAKNKIPRGATTFIVLEPRVERGQRFVLENSLTIGRNDSNAIALPDDTYISGTHARIDTRNGDVVISDLNSTNGTFVNGTRVSGDRVLRKGDRIQTGTLVMEMQS